MSNGTQGNANPNASYLTGLRTIRVFNASEYTAPGFAIMRFVNVGESNDGSGGNVFSRQRSRQNEVEWYVGRPNAASVRDFETGNFCFNGPTPIKPGRWGVATMDYPAQVIHDGSDDSLPNGFECGPVADEWFVLSASNGGFGYHCMSHDFSGAGGTNADGQHTVWLTPRRELGVACGVYSGTTAVGEGELVALTQASSDLLTIGVELSNDIIRAIAPGFYHFGWQCSLTSEEDRGTTLRLDTMHRAARTRNAAGTVVDEGAETATGFYAFREQEVEQDGYTNDIRQGVENVACTGQVNLDYDEGISIKNVSGYDIEAQGFKVWLSRVGPYVRTKPAGSLSYS